MKYLKTFESFVTTNEILKTDASHLDKVISKLKTAIKDSKLFNDIKNFIVNNEIDPYATFDNIISGVKARFPEVESDEKIMMAFESLLQEDDSSVNEGKNAANWTKAQLDKELKDLQQGARDAGDIDDSMAFDIADSWIGDNKDVEKAIAKHYPGVSDFMGFVANRIA